MNKEQCLEKINQLVILPDDYHFIIDSKDYYHIDLYKNNIKIQSFILADYSDIEIIKFGLEVGEYLD